MFLSFQIYSVTKESAKSNMLKRMAIDNTNFGVEEFKVGILGEECSFVWDSSAEQWKMHDDTLIFEKHQRGPMSYGPMRQVPSYSSFDTYRSNMQYTDFPFAIFDSARFSRSRKGRERVLCTNGAVPC